jgi:hypothetical protein
VGIGRFRASHKQTSKTNVVRKIAGTVRRLPSIVVKHKSLIAAFALGAVLAGVTTYLLARNNSQAVGYSPAHSQLQHGGNESRSKLDAKPQEKAQAAYEKAPANNTQHSVERSKKNLDLTKQRVKDEVSAGRITQQQGDDLDKKLDEAYAYLNQTGDKRPSNEEIRAKRVEWRAWAKEHHISYGYFVNLY